MSRYYVPRYSFYLVSALCNGSGCVKVRWHQSGHSDSYERCCSAYLPWLLPNISAVCCIPVTVMRFYIGCSCKCPHLQGLLDFDQVVLHITYDQDSWSENGMKRHPAINPEPLEHTHTPPSPGQMRKWVWKCFVNYKVLNRCEGLYGEYHMWSRQKCWHGPWHLSPFPALRLCDSLALKIQDQALELLAESGNADDYLNSSLFLLSFVRKAGCVREEMHRRGTARKAAQGHLQPSLPLPRLSWLLSSS